MREVGKPKTSSYISLHMWIYKHYGKASYCENDVNHNAIAKRFEWANLSGEYKRDRSDYIQLCPSCHRKRDIGKRCRKGHEFTPENTYLRKEGWRVCKTCQQEGQRRFNAKVN